MKGLLPPDSKPYHTMIVVKKFAWISRIPEAIMNMSVELLHEAVEPSPAAVALLYDVESQRDLLQKAHGSFGTDLPPEYIGGDERWLKILEHVPGIRSLGIQTIYGLYNKVTNLDVINVEPESDDGKKVALVEIISNHGNLVISQEQGRIHFFPKYVGTPSKLEYLALVLADAAKCDLDGGIVVHKPIKSRADIPYAMLARGMADDIPKVCGFDSAVQMVAPPEKPAIQPAMIKAALARVAEDVPTSVAEALPATQEAPATEGAGERGELVRPIVSWPPEREEAPASVVIPITSARQPVDAEALDALRQCVNAQQPVAEPYVSPLQKMFRFAKRVACSIKQNAPSILTGFAVSAAIRLGAQLAFAQSMTTNYSVAMTLAFSVGVGALAGGVSKLVTTACYGGDKKKEKNWQYKAFVQGMGWGAAGSVLGAGFAQWLASHDFSGLFGHQDVVQAHVDSAASLPADSAATTGVEAASAAAASVDPADAVRHALTADQFNKLPKAIQKLAYSNKPEDIVAFGKHASAKLFNGASRAGRKAAAHLIERTLSYADATGVQNHTVEKLHADLAYMAAWGKGMVKDKALAIFHARRAGSVMNHFGARLLKLLGPPAPA